MSADVDIEKTANGYLGTFESVHGEPDPTFDTGGRRTLRIEKRGDREHRHEVPLVEADVVSSQVGDDLHKPCIDVDLPVRVIDSTTPGHFHLYIEHAMTWDQYASILQALANAGVVEQGYVMASEFRKATHLRLPWVKKVPEEVPFP